MSRVERCIDNAPMEGFWGILKCEMYYLNYFETYEELVVAVEQFIYYYNHQRHQHKLDCLPPATYRHLAGGCLKQSQNLFSETLENFFVFSSVYLTGRGSHVSACR